MSIHKHRPILTLLLALAATLACLATPALAQALEAPETLKPELGTIEANRAVLQGILSPHSPGELGDTYEFVYRATETGECKGAGELSTTPGMVLADVLDAGRGGSQRGEDCSALTAEGLVGAAFAIVHARLLRGERQALLGLVGQLMGMIVLPYLGPAAARREQALPAPKMPTPAHNGLAARSTSSEDPLQGLRMRWTYRTARALQGIYELPCASNRQVADYAGIHDQGQVSKLLARLARLDLIENTGEGQQRGEPNAWSLTPLGEQVAERLRVNTTTENAA